MLEPTELAGKHYNFSFLIQKVSLIIIIIILWIGHIINNITLLVLLITLCY